MEIDWVAIGSIATTAIVGVTLWTFIAENRARHKREATERKRMAVSRALTTMEAVTHRLSTPVFIRMWLNPEIHYALAAARLRHELDDEDIAVAYWTISRTQAMTEAASDKEARAIAIEVGTKLVEWNKGTIDTKWFDEQVARRPVSLSFKPSALKRATRWTLRFGELMVVLGLPVAGVAAATRIRSTP